MDDFDPTWRSRVESMPGMADILERLDKEGASYRWEDAGSGVAPDLEDDANDLPDQAFDPSLTQFVVFDPHGEPLVRMAVGDEDPGIVAARALVQADSDMQGWRESRGQSGRSGTI